MSETVDLSNIQIPVESIRSVVEFVTDDKICELKLNGKQAARFGFDINALRFFVMEVDKLLKEKKEKEAAPAAPVEEKK